MTCLNCNDQGFKKRVERKNGVTSTVYTLCRCETGTQLEKLWEKYPSWVGAPYSFFHIRSLDSGNPNDVITGGQ